MTQKTLGLVGARGHVGRELLALVHRHPGLKLVYAASRSLDGAPISDVAPEYEGYPLRYTTPTPEDVAALNLDVAVLALPNGMAAPYAEALSPDTAIVDVSSDYRFDDTWAYGLPELHRRHLTGAKRIASPGCYATGLQLLVDPVKHLLAQPAQVFGISGYSGAGTTPNDRNDIEKLHDSVQPYGLVGHTHEREATRHLGVPVRFMPHVAGFFRGIGLTASFTFKEPLTTNILTQIYAGAYADEPLIFLQEGAPAIRAGQNQPGVIIGGITVGADGRTASVVAAEDNLLKGAAVQAMQNVNLALGLEEFAGILPWKTAPQGLE